MRVQCAVALTLQLAKPSSWNELRLTSHRLDLTSWVEVFTLKSPEFKGLTTNVPATYHQQSIAKIIEKWLNTNLRSLSPVRTSEAVKSKK